MTVKRYTSPWSTSLIVISTVVSLICAGPGVALALDGRFWIAALLVGIVFISALFTVRGYSLASRDLLVHRLFWDDSSAAAVLLRVIPVSLRQADSNRHTRPLGIKA